MIQIYFKDSALFTELLKYFRPKPNKIPYCISISPIKRKEDVMTLATSNKYKGYQMCKYKGSLLVLIYENKSSA